MTKTKFWLAVAAFVAACAFLATGHVDQDTWREVVVWIMGLYGAGNIGATFAHNRGD